MLAAKDELFTRPSGGYTIARSVRLRSSASAYFNRTPASATNTKTWTWSGWFKNSTTAVDNTLIDGYVDVNNETVLRTSGNQISFAVWTSGAYTVLATTPAVFRDPSAWYHIVFSLDTTQATNSNGVKLYVNGVQQTFTFTNYTQNATTLINSNVLQRIGRSFISGADRYTDGYLTEINFIDGQALTPSSFGTTNAITGVWQPAKYTGTYGTNGFYLNFSDNSGATATTIGKDYSGNGNNWTPNNISVTAGVTYDSMTDVPTLTSATAANYCVLNPLNPYGNSGGVMSISDGNLKGTGANTTRNVYGTTAVNSGKWYWEIYVSSYVNLSEIGVSDDTGCIGTGAVNYWAYTGAGNKEINGATTAYGATYTTGDTIGVALDLSANTLTFYKNNTSQGAITSVTGLLRPHCYITTAGVFIANFGQQPFTYTPPTGFVALNTYNLPASTIINGAAYMAATTYTGTGATQSISNAVNSVSFQPDLVWLKVRNQAYGHALFDSVRGVGNGLQSNNTNAEAAWGTSTLASFNSGGFGLGADVSYLIANSSGNTFVGWQWKAGTTSASNTNGSITSTVSANTTAGFSVVTYTTPASGTFTVGHGLGVAPSFIINRIRTITNNWYCYHVSLGNNTEIVLNTTAAATSAGGDWNSTTPTSTVFSMGSGWAGSYSMVSYCFAPVAGYSAFGSYTGNGSADGPFVYTGFRPRFVMIKGSSFVSPWQIHDSSRNPYNVVNANLSANTSDAEGSYDILDYVSNGFKLRNTGANLNSNGATLIYMAFAENPFKNSLAR